MLKYLGVKGHNVYNLLSSDSAKNKTKQPRASITYTDKYGTMLMIIESGLVGLRIHYTILTFWNV